MQKYAEINEIFKKWIRRKLEDLSSEISEGSAAGTLPAKTKISTELGRKRRGIQGCKGCEQGGQ